MGRPESELASKPAVLPVRSLPLVGGVFGLDLDISAISGFGSIGIGLLGPNRGQSEPSQCIL